MTPARAVEVAAVFEDSVIAVKHLTQQRTPNRRVTQALIGGGALSLMGALGTFIASVHQVAVMRRAHEAAVAAHRAFGPFVLPGGGRWLDFVVALCLVAGTWALFLGAGRWLAARRTHDFLVGPTARADVVAPLPADVPLVQRNSCGGGWLVNVSAPMRGEMSQGDSLPAPISVPSQLTIADGTRAFIDVGALRFIVGATDEPARMSTPVRIDWAQEAYIGAVGMAAGIFLGLLYLIPPDPKSLALDPIHSEIIVSYLIKAPAPPEVPSKKGMYNGSGGGREHAGARGAAGNPKLPKNQHGAMKIPGKSPDPRIGKGYADREARDSAPMQILAQFEQSHIGSIFSRESALGPDAEAALGSLVGTMPGGAGDGGLDLFGTHKGGGGEGTDTIGVNKLGRIGPWGPGQPGGKYGPPGGSNLAIHKVGTVIPIKTPEFKTTDGLSKDIIKRVIHFHHNEIKFCYDKRLAVKATLGSGRVVARFLIGGNGRVLTAGIEASTLNDRDVEGCIAEAIRRWDFPKPSDNSTVTVSYPFVLQAPQ